MAFDINFDPDPMIFNIYPFENQDNKGSHHGGVGTVVLVVHISDVLIIVVSPGGPGSKHNNRSL